MNPWFHQLRSVLRYYYPQEGPTDVVGYLRGSANPNVWREMIHTKRPQMIVLGSLPPTEKEWEAAGVPNRPETQTIKLNQLDRFIITYSGFIYRPWGDISEYSDSIARNYSITITQFQRNMPNLPHNLP